MTTYRKIVTQLTVVAVSDDAVTLKLRKRGREPQLLTLSLHEGLEVTHDCQIDVPDGTRTGAAWHTLLDILGYEPEGDGG